ncbi:MAG: hypothetical protein ABWZ40_03890 [Caulobacterales bacterium]
MATEARSGGNGFLYFVVGALVVIVGVLAYVMYGSGASQNNANAALERSADAVGDAANAVENRAKQTPDIQPVPAPNMPAPAQP